MLPKRRRVARARTTEDLGWAEIRDVCAAFESNVARGIRDHEVGSQKECSALDDDTTDWVSICGHPAFAHTALTFRLEELNCCATAWDTRGKYLNAPDNLA
jgi:hypothetical protein